MADQAHDLALGMDGGDQPGDRLISAEFVGCPASRHHYGVKILSGHAADQYVGFRPEAVLPRDRNAGFQAGDPYAGALFSQAHHGDPELQILEAFGDQHRDRSAVKPSRHARTPPGR